MEHDIFRSMNTTVVMAAQNNTGFEETRAAIYSAEKRFTRFSEESELSQLNRSSGDWFDASADMLSLLQTCLEMYTRTDGWFDPTILPALEFMGYNLSFEKLLAIPSAAAVPAALPGWVRELPPFGALELDLPNQRVRLPRGMRIDLGGIAKGWIAEQAARILAHTSPYCAVNAGGDMYLIGLPADLPHWEVALENPHNPDLDLTTLTLEPGAVATSSISKRTWVQGDIQRHHLINPRSGFPALTPWLSVTVFATHTAEAEAFAKAVLIGGPEAALSMQQKNPSLNYLAVDSSNMLWFPQDGEIKCAPLMN